MNKDPQLNRVISKDLLHFLLTEDINEVVISNPDDSQGQTIKSKFSKIAESLRSFAFQELSKVFLPTTNKKQQLEENQLEKKDEKIITLNQAIEQQICPQLIFEVDLNFYVNYQSISRSTSDQDNEILEKIISNTPPEKLSLSQSQLEISQSEESMKEFQMLQGGFKAILDTLLKATSEVQLDLLQTIEQILRSNSRNKFEFKRINGYQSLSELIVQKKNENDLDFQNQFYTFLRQISTNESIIDDFDAFTLLLELLPIEQEQILNILTQILNQNWKNVVIAKRLKLYYYLAIIQMKQYLNSDQIIDKICNIDNDYIFSSLKNILQKMKFDKSDDNKSILFTLYQTINQLEGFYSLEFEAIQSQLALLFMDEEEIFQQIIGFVFKMVEQKLIKKCRYLNSFDHQSEIAFKNFTLIFEKLYHNIQETRKQIDNPNLQSYFVNFIQIIQIINEFIHCDHNIKKPDIDIVKNMVSQNRCEQFMNLINPFLKQVTSKQILELFDFECNQNNLAISHLKFRLNQVLFRTLSGIIKQSDLKIDQQTALYLTYSQYEMWNQLEKQPPNPINSLFDFLMDISKKNNQYIFCISNLLYKIKLEDENAQMIENLIIFFKGIELKNYELLVMIYLTLSKNLYNYINMVNLYPIIIQFIETFINKIDLDIWLDFIFSSDIMKKINEENVGIAISDLMSLISIHSMLQGQVYEKMINQEYLTNALATLQYDMSKEQGIKLIYSLYLLNIKNKSKNQIYTYKNKFFKIVQKLIDQEDFSNSICNIVYKLVFWNFDNYHILYTENSSNVSSVMGRSEFAEIIQKQQKQYLENKQPIQHILNIECLELFFIMLSKNKSVNYIVEILKIFETILDNQNLQTLLDSNIMKSLTLLQQHQDKKINQQLNSIVRILIYYDLNKSNKLKIIDILKRQENSSEILLDFLKDLKDNPIIKNDHNIFVKNFANLIQSFEELIGYNEEIYILLFQIINLMASKNSPEIRSQLKQFNLLELRDYLSLQIIRYKLEPQQLMDILHGIGFQQLSNTRNFKEFHCIAYLLQKLLQNKDHFALPILIIKILKYDISNNEDNRKYLCKLLQNDNLISFFYPQMVRKQSKSLKCFDSEDTKNQRSPSPENELSTISANMPVDHFLQLFLSEKLQDERQQIKLTIEKALIPVESENKKQILNQNQKKNNRITKLIELEQTEQLKISTSNNDWEIRIQSRLQKSNEKSKTKVQKIQEQFEVLLGEGENQWFKLCLGQ